MTQCCKRIFSSGSTYQGAPCKRKATVLRDGKHYCSIHDPDAVNARRDKAAKARAEEYAVRQKLAERDRLERNKVKAMAELAAELRDALNDMLELRDATIRSEVHPTKDELGIVANSRRLLKAYNIIDRQGVDS